MPEVGGGPSTSILMFGSDLSMSDQFLFGLATSLPSLSGTCSASARNTCAIVSLSAGPAFDWAMVRPSKPTLISTMSLTPFFWQSSNSLFFMRREALVTSGWPAPTPAQNSFMPPPVPVDSTTGVLPRAGLAELLGHRRGERIDGRGTDDPDLVARRRRVGHRDHSHDGRSRREGYELAVHADSPWLDWRPLNRPFDAQPGAIDCAVLATTSNTRVTIQAFDIKRDYSHLRMLPEPLSEGRRRTAPASLDEARWNNGFKIG